MEEVVNVKDFQFFEVSLVSNPPPGCELKMDYTEMEIHKGDSAVINGELYFYNGSRWIPYDGGFQQTKEKTVNRPYGVDETKYKKPQINLELCMNKEEVIGYTKAVMRSVMIDNLFEPADIVTFGNMESAIIDELIDGINNIEDHIIEANVTNFDDDVQVTVTISWKNESDATVIKASYVNCPTFEDEKSVLKPHTLKTEKQVAVEAFDDAMGIL